MEQTLTLKALDQMRRGQIIDSKVLWRRAVKANPYDEDAWFGLLNALEISSDLFQSSLLDEISENQELIAEFQVIMEQLSDIYAKNGRIDKSIEILQKVAYSKPLNSRQLDKLLTRLLMRGRLELFPLIESLVSEHERITSSELLLSIASYLMMKNRFKEASRVLIQFFQVVDDYRIDLLARTANLLRDSVHFPKRDLIVSQLIQKAISVAKLSSGFYYHEQLARFCLEEGLLQEALLLLEVVRQRGYECAEIWEDIGDLFALMEEGDPIAAYQQALELDPFNERLIVRYADLLMKEGSLETSIEVLEDAILRGVKKEPIIIKLAQGYLLLDDPSRAHETLREKMLESSEDQVIQELLAEIYLKLGNPLKASKIAVKLLKKQFTDVSIVTNNANLWRILASSLEQLERWEQALAVYEILTSHIPDDVNLWLRKVDVLIELSQHEAALVTLKTLARQYPEDDEIWRRLGQCSMLVGDLASAKQYLETSLALHPNSHRTLVELGKMQEKKGDIEKARRYYEESLRRHPNYIVAWLRLVLLDITEDKALTSLPKLQKILSIDPNNIFAIQLLAQVLIQEISKSHRERIRQLALQRFILEKISLVSPDVQAELPNYLLELGFRELALQVASALYRRHPREPKIVLVFAASLLSNGKHVPEANIMLRELLKIVPHLPELHFWIGKYELSQQNYEAAVDYLTVARHLEPKTVKYWDEELWARAMSSRRLEGVLPLIKYVQRAFPADTSLMVTMAMIYYMYHHFDESETLLERCLEKNPRIVKAWILLARVRRLKGLILDAVITVKNGLKFNPNNAELLEELQRLKNDTSWDVTSVQSIGAVKHGHHHYHELLVQLQEYNDERGMDSFDEIRDLLLRKDFETLEDVILSHLHEATSTEMKLFLLHVMIRVKILRYQLKQALRFIDLSYCMRFFSTDTNDLLFTIIEMLEIQSDSLRLLKEAITLFNLPWRKWMESLFTNLESPSGILKNLFQQLQFFLMNDESDALTWMFLALAFRTFQLHESSKQAFMKALMLEIPEDDGTLQLFLFLKESLDVA